MLIVYLILILIIIFIIYITFITNNFSEPFKNNDNNEVNNNDSNEVNEVNEVNINEVTKVNNNDSNEPNEVNNNEKLNIKKTNKYTLVYSNRDIYVWEPNPIDDYFAIGQYITIDSKPPIESAYLVKYNPNNTPKDYSLINIIDDKYGIWKPVPKNNNMKFVSYLISRNKPSLNKIQALYNQFIEESYAQELIKDVKSYLNKNGQSINNKFWKINNSPHFTVNNNEKTYCLSDYQAVPTQELLIKPTKKYIKIWSNMRDNRTITVWRPQPEQNYKMLGDIVINNSEDPNNVLETPTVHKDYGKSVLYYKKSLCYNTKDTDVCFWRPKNREGFTTLGSLISLGNSEPSNNILYSIPIEYVNINPDAINIWNNKDLNIWSNDNNLFVTNTFNKPFNIYKLNKKFMTYENDITDNKGDIVLNFIPKNISVKNIEEQIITTLSNKLDIDKYRVKINNIDKLNNKIHLIIKQKRSNSLDILTKDIIDEMVDIIYKRNITVKDNKQIILVINNIIVNKSKENIFLNNKLFLDKIKDI